jgi:hypothetical protein
MNLLLDKRYILLFIAVIFLVPCLFTGCAFLHAYSIALATEYDGKIVIENEKNVKLYLENIIQNYDDYSMRAFNRKAISYKVKKTPGTTHSFYVIYTADGNYHTLNFSATGKWATSQGAWAMDTEADITSYIDYTAGKNRWEIEEMATRNGINTLSTVKNILIKIRGNSIFYFRSKVNVNNKTDNCNTALRETLAENE